MFYWKIWNILGSSSKVFYNLRKSSNIFGKFWKCSETFVWPSKQFWKIFGNLRKVVLNLRKIVKNAVISMSMCVKKDYTWAGWYEQPDEFYVVVARTISHVWAQRTSEILFLPLEHKIHIFQSQPCNIFYIFYSEFILANTVLLSNNVNNKQHCK